MKMSKFLASAAISMILVSPAIAGSSALGVQGDDLYSFATAAVQKNGAILGELENITDHGIKIVRAESEVAEHVELHTHLMDDGVMMMREVESYSISENGELTLKPSGDHIMLMGLKAPLKQGDVFSVRLFDANDMSIEVPVLVRAPGDTPAESDEE